MGTFHIIPVLVRRRDHRPVGRERQSPTIRVVLIHRVQVLHLDVVVRMHQVEIGRCGRDFRRVAVHHLPVCRPVRGVHLIDGRVVVIVVLGGRGRGRLERDERGVAPVRGESAVAVVGVAGAHARGVALGAGGLGGTDFAVGAVHHLDELPALQHEEEVGVLLQELGVEVLRRLDRLAHAPG